MNSLFLTIVNMSLMGSFAILAVILLHVCLTRAPKSFSYALWLIVLFRLVCPVSFESMISILPIHSDTIPQDLVYQQEPRIHSGVSSIDYMVNQSMPQAAPQNSINPMQIVILLGEAVWFFGIAILILYSLFSLYRLNRRLRSAVHVEKNIYLAENLKTAFVLGVLNPRIFLPTNLSQEETAYILKHEQTHIQRHDPLIKIVAFIVLCIHWFNPLVWLAFVLMTKDMEMSCDEAVIREMGTGSKKEYSKTLLALAAGHSMIGGAPLAFGEGGIKGRIKNILKYKKPAFRGMLGLTVLVLVAAIALVSNPKRSSSINDIEDSVREDFSNVQGQLNTWAQAFVNQDANTILSMTSDEVQTNMEDNGLLVKEDDYAGFGWSSPWPMDWTQYTIYNITENSACILYTALASDPHVTSWEEALTYQWDGRKLQVTGEKITYFDSISSGSEYNRAYPQGIQYTGMDYLTNGLGAALNRNAKESSHSSYRRLFDPETALLDLLNLLGNPSKVQIQWQPEDSKGEIGNAQITFLEDEVTTYIQMIQPYGEDGIWIPQTDAVDLE